MTFKARLENIFASTDSLLAVGLDPDLDKIPAFIKDFESPIVEFNKSIINATSDLVCAYKMNLAFYEQFGPSGWKSLKKTISLIPENVLILLDGKRADIANTSRMYAKAQFEELKSDAITVNPYMGHDSLAPFLQDSEKGAFVLCLTSNPGASDFQFLETNGQYLFEAVARKAVEWNKNENVGLVVGATHAEYISRIRQIAPGIPLLIPGVGAQGGDLVKAVTSGLDKDGAGIIIPASRKLLYVSDDFDFASKSRNAAMELRDQINQIRSRS